MTTRTRPSGRRLPIFLVPALIALLVAPLSATAETSSSSRDPGLLGKEVTGTGELPNFTAEGANLIRLQGGAFDPLADPLPAPGKIPLVNEVTLPAGVAQYWLLQVNDHEFPQAADAVSAGGGLITGYVHDHTYMVRATPAQRTTIAADPVVRWMGYYQPAWRVPVAAAGRPGLLELTGTRTYEVHVFVEDPNPGAVGQSLKGMAGVEVVDDASVVVVVRATAAQVPAIAALPSVEWIGIKPKAVLLNSNARWVNDTGIRDLYSATAPGRLTGAGQTAAVADTAVNYTYDLNHRAHVAFRDCDASGVCKEAIYTQRRPGIGEEQMNDVVNHNTNHRKMVAFFDLGDTGPNPFDDSSHGSHTGGSVDGDQPPYNQYTADDGLAPAAKHVHQNIGTSGGGLSIRPRDPASVSETSGANGNPDDYKTETAGGKYRPLEDARTHNDSWGAIYPLVDDGSAVRLDQVVWDHEDLTVSVSAGNDGPAPGSIGSPSTAKNELSSGASANGRQPMVSIDSMASFSSHGPTPDLRYGPDLATPGQIVVSVKGGSTDAYHVAQGTSMSSPILTGLATLVRQYFFDGYARAGGDGFAAGSPSAARRHNPSAALVKAALINGAVRMRGFYTGDDGSDRASDGQWPSSGQGFGRVNLANSLFFTGDQTNNWYADVYRGDTTGDANFQPFPASAAAQTRTFQLKVAAGQPLDVTLAWTDAPNLLPAGTPALVNNLDLVVSGPGTGGGAMTYVGNNMNSRATPSVAEAETLAGNVPRDIRNPTERVRLANPTPGTYTVTVEASPIAMGNQGFALAANGNIAPVGGSFSPGPPLQANQAGSPTVSNVSVTPVSSNTARVRFQTNEPTTATADTTPAIPGETFTDSYNEGKDGFTGLNEGPVETSDEYADKPVVGTQHEMLLTGFSPGQTYTIQLQVKDLANNSVTQNTTLKAPATVFQADNPDIGQCYEGDPTCQWDSAPTATQLYAGNVDGGALGAFMFRTPAELDPSQITMATVEMVSTHNWVIPYTEDPILYVDLLADEDGIEDAWGGQDYATIHTAPADARFWPETTHKRGAYQKYAFTLGCADLQKLKDSLANDKAAFRWDSNDSGYFAMEFGFNRRSRGPDLRPKLVLYTNATGTNPTGQVCDPSTPAPTISQVGIHEGIEANSMTVSWETDVDSDSFVLFRQKGTIPWTQVGTPALTKIHHVQVFGLDSTKHYEFVVRSAACNGAATTDTNGGAAYDFFPPPAPDPGTRTEHASYTFEADANGWTVATTTSPVPPDSTWVRGAPGAGGLASNGWHVAVGGNPASKGYSDEDETMLTSPPVAFAGAQVGIEFQLARDLEEDFDFVHVQYSANGTDWTTAASFTGTNADYPDYEPRDVRFNHPNPGGSLQIRFRFVSDELISSPAYLGASVDEVKFASYPNAAPAQATGAPLTGPVPPPSAGATGLSPTFRFGPASDADTAAGTGACSVEARADLSLTKTDSPDPVLAGQNLTYTLTVRNNGPNPASGVSVVDTLPATVNFVSATPSQGGPCTGTATVTCPLGVIDSLANATVTIVVKPTQAAIGTITNSATVSTSATDPNPSNNTATATTTVRPAADLSIQKSTTTTTAHVGQPVTFTVKVTNGGPSPATSITVTDTFSKNAGYASAAPGAGWSCTAKPGKRQVICTFTGSLGANQSTSFQLTVKPTSKPTLTNTATITSSSPTDPTPDNNSATVNVPVSP
jgi:uncharacterized repeat protein (TIGR01451 family)